MIRGLDFSFFHFSGTRLTWSLVSITAISARAYRSINIGTMKGRVFGSILICWAKETLIHVPTWSYSGIYWLTTECNFINVVAGVQKLRPFEKNLVSELFFRRWAITICWTKRYSMKLLTNGSSENTAEHYHVLLNTHKSFSHQRNGKCLCSENTKKRNNIPFFTVYYTVFESLSTFSNAISDKTILWICNSLQCVHLVYFVHQRWNLDENLLCMKESPMLLFYYYRPLCIRIWFLMTDCEIDSWESHFPFGLRIG